MIFTDLNNGTKVNLAHTSGIELRENQIIYQQARGSNIIEYFDTNEEALQKYEKLKEDNLIN